MLETKSALDFAFFFLFLDSKHTQVRDTSGLGVKPKYENNLYFNIPYRHNLKVILYSIFSMPVICDLSEEFRGANSYLWHHINAQNALDVGEYRFWI